MPHFFLLVKVSSNLADIMHVYYLKTLLKDCYKYQVHFYTVVSSPSEFYTSQKLNSVTMCDFFVEAWATRGDRIFLSLAENLNFSNHKLRVLTQSDT